MTTKPSIDLKLYFLWKRVSAELHVVLQPFVAWFPQHSALWKRKAIIAWRWAVGVHDGMSAPGSGICDDFTEQTRTQEFRIGLTEVTLGILVGMDAAYIPFETKSSLLFGLRDEQNKKS